MSRLDDLRGFAQSGIDSVLEGAYLGAEMFAFSWGCRKIVYIAPCLRWFVSLTPNLALPHVAGFYIAVTIAYKVTDYTCKKIVRDAQVEIDGSEASLKKMYFKGCKIVVIQAENVKAAAAKIDAVVSARFGWDTERPLDEESPFDLVAKTVFFECLKDELKQESIVHNSFAIYSGSFSLRALHFLGKYGFCLFKYEWRSMEKKSELKMQEREIRLLDENYKEDTKKKLQLQDSSRNDLKLKTEVLADCSLLCDWYFTRLEIGFEGILLGDEALKEVFELRIKQLEAEGREAEKAEARKIYDRIWIVRSFMDDLNKIYYWSNDECDSRK